MIGLSASIRAPACRLRFLGYRSLSLGPLARFDELRKQGKIREDPRQLPAMHKLDELARKIAQNGIQKPNPAPRAPVKSGGLLTFAKSFMGSSKPSASSGSGSASAFGPASSRDPVNKGLYIWGGVGSGKTMMMDLFYDSVDGVKKTRKHFHPFMLDIHQRLHDIRVKSGGGTHDPIPRVAREIVENQAELLCLDEFQVTDVADAMILRHLFSSMFDAGCVVVATSNRRPEDLYLGGINREVFLPFIDLLKQHCDVVFMDDGQDHRLLGTISVGVYHSPQGPSADKALDDVFKTLSADGGSGSSQASQQGQGQVGPDEIQVMMGRTLPVPLASRGRVARFDFAQLCTSAVGAADYLALARAYPAVIVANVPQMRYGERDRIRRFINLLDVFYDHGVRFVCSAAAPPNTLFIPDDAVGIAPDAEAAPSEAPTGEGAQTPGAKGTSVSLGGQREDEKFATSRAVSRIIEMQTEEYLRNSASKRAKALGEL